MTDNLFGHLVPRFSASPENLATESLFFILQPLPAARGAFFRFLEQTGCAPLPGNLRLANQSMEDEQSIPDLVGFDGKNRPIKAKLAATDRLIDRIVYALYGLTEEEIAIVEGKS